MVAIPKAMLDALDLAPDAAVGLSIRGGRLVVDPKNRRRYTLDELLAQCRPLRGARASSASGSKARRSGASLFDGTWRHLPLITGVVRCDQPRALDLRARGGKKFERCLM
jgi:antitoxin component of MazEF toxin-antitoxin module